MENCTMKINTALRRSYGKPEVIHFETINLRDPNEDEVLIKVYATTVNRTDCANLTANPFIMRFMLGLFKPKDAQIGTDFAGEVICVGENMTEFKKGDRVFGFNDMGAQSQAEYLLIKPNGNLLKIPEKVDYKAAAASLEGAHYAYSFTHKTEIKPGHKILINGATGAIGSALLQYLNTYDVEISVTCKSEHFDLVKSLGATHVIDYRKEDFTDNKNYYDFIFDAVGKRTYGECKSSLTAEGTYISSEMGPYAQNLFLALTSFIRRKKVVFPVPYPISTTMPYIKNCLENETLKPVIDRELPFEKIKEAYMYVMTGEKLGNVVLLMD